MSSARRPCRNGAVRRPVRAWVAGVATGALALTLALGAPAQAAVRHTGAGPRPITGTIVDLGFDFLTVQTPGRHVGIIDRLTAAATEITAEDTPYVWGGGHGQAGVASVGVPGPGYNGRRTGFDCSGVVAAVLVRAGLWPAGTSVPGDYGIITELAARHLIAPGVGAGPAAVTLYDHPGHHIFMNIDGRFFGTEDGIAGVGVFGVGDARGGAGWLDDGAPDAGSRQFQAYHFLPSVLAASTREGIDETFTLPADGLFAATERNVGISLGHLFTANLLEGEQVRVSYVPDLTGKLRVASVAVIRGGPPLAPVATNPPATTPTPTTPTPTTPTTTTPTTTTPTTTTPTTTTTTTATTTTTPTTTTTATATPSG
jgi:cell division septation protein DedD